MNYHLTGRTQLIVALTALAVLGTCNAHANKNRKEHRSAQSKRGAPVRIDPLGSSVDALRRDDFSEAYRISAAALGRRRYKSIRPELQWVSAKAALALGKKSAGEKALEALSQSEHPLQPWAKLLLAEQVIQTRSSEAVRLLDQLPSRWAGKYRADMTRIQAAIHLAQWDEAAEKLARLWERSASQVSTPNLAMPIADHYAGQDDPEQKIKALQLYRKVATRNPLSSVGKQATEKMTELVELLYKSKEISSREMPFADLYAQGDAYFRAGQYKAAAEHWLELAARRRFDEAQRCKAQFHAAKALMLSRDREASAKEFNRATRQCEDLSMIARSHFYAARSHATRDEHKDALKHYRKLRRRAPDHRLADDAMFRAALHSKAMGKLDAFRKALRRLSDTYPQGDMQNSAWFALGWESMDRGLTSQAEKYFASAQQYDHQENEEGQQGRSMYWRARMLEKLESAEQALSLYKKIADDFPLSFYAQLSLNRLETLDSEAFNQVRESWKFDASVTPKLSFDGERQLVDRPVFQRAKALLRVGEHGLAWNELEAADILGTDVSQAQLWFVAQVLNEAGAYRQSTLLARRRLRHFLKTPPSGYHLTYWRISYPKAYAPIIEELGSSLGVPASFIRAIAREESGFEPEAVSTAKAYGLVQVIAPTAKRYAEPLGLPYDVQALKTPAINLKIGASYMKALYEKYHSSIFMIPSAYNAGENAVDRWLGQYEEIAFDRWVEQIPYAETQRYTRRVLQTYGIYLWLSEQRLVEFPGELSRSMLSDS